MTQIYPITAEPILSIVVPVYNGAKYIRDTLESLVSLAQLVDCEVIFQNALSTDGTTEILDEFCGNRQRWFHYNEKDAGQSDAINKGISRAIGRWVTWLCADDILLPSVAEMLREAEQVGADVVYGDGIFILPQGITPAIGTETCLPGDLAKKRLLIQQPGTCILRKVWQAAGGVNIDLNWLMDYDLFLRLESMNMRFYRAKHFVAIARLHKDAKTSSGSIKRLFEVWSILFRSHVRRPEYFRLKPYLVYLFEYVIKHLEARDLKLEGRMKMKTLPLLHQYFWKLAMPEEEADIQQRFQKIYQELANYLNRLAAIP
ncbi:glycosyl transferase family 2 [Candidatus Vecturithrix granuli]|uniref:Glycosyl transferase family 2 n=1 Tax=Vecturithrix granuli TaxID=1499967 RepID=A0A081BW78_VECG1|nr:glycosyl transferase family 2 [Candidatus Vecturithrix granuli]